MTEALTLKKNCPDCRSFSTLSISHNTIYCKNETCNFSLTYCCPLCDEVLDNSHFTDEEKGEKFTCPRCNQGIYLQKIQYLLENSMIIDHQNRCGYCNGPTIHRENNLSSSRCFSYPKCSGQAGLFGQTQPELVFLDFETTGLEAGKDHIIEIGAVKIDQDGLEYSFQTLIKPPVSIAPHIVKITGITDDMVKDSPEINQPMADFITFIGDAKLIAHNADFDLPWLLTTAILLNLPLKNNKVLCTLKWARKLSEPRCSLGALTKKYQIVHNNAHRALADAMVTKELYFVLANTNEDGPPEESLENYRVFANKLAKKRA